MGYYIFSLYIMEIILWKKRSILVLDYFVLMLCGYLPSNKHTYDTLHCHCITEGGSCQEGS